MRIIIVGGGQLAYYLIKILLPYRHQIIIIDEQIDVCNRIANDFENIQVYLGDGTNVQMLEKAGAYQADFYVAVTGKDENNLIGCEIAKNRFKVGMTVARVNNPKNSEMFYRIGVDRIYSSTQILAGIIEQEIDYVGMRSILRLGETSKTIIEFVLSERSPACNHTLQEYRFPGTSKVVLIKRENGAVEMPYGNLRMVAGDTILLVCDEHEYDAIWRTMVQR
jgi:trk system potassium uptake protein